MIVELEKPTRKFLPHVLWLFIFLSLCFLSSGKLPETSGEVELLFPQYSNTYEWLLQERQNFEDVYTDTIVIQGDVGFDPFQLEELEEELLSLSGIRAIVLPPLQTGKDPFRLRDPIHKSLRLIVKIESAISQSDRKALHDEIEGVLERFAALSPLRAGSFYTTQEVAGAVSKETERVIPWIVVVLCVCLLLFFRSVWLTIVILLSTGLSLGTVLFGCSVLGYPLGPVSQLAPPFMLALGSSFHIHFASRYLQSSLHERDELRGELRQGIGLAACTTALSLLSLCFLDVADVTRFAFLASCGVILSAFSSLYLLEPILQGRPPLGTVQSLIPFKKYYFLFQRTTLGIVLFATVLLAFGLFSLEVHTDPLRFLPKTSTALTSIRQVNKIFPGNHYLSLLLDSTTRLSREKLQALEDTLKGLRGVENVIGPTTFAELSSHKGVSDFLSGFSLRSSHIPEEFLSADGQKGRLLLETHLEGKHLLRLRDEIEKAASNLFSPSRVEFGVTSLELILAEQTQHIVHGLLQSLATTITTVFLLLLVLFKSFRVASIGLVPNMMPLLGVFGLLGYSSKELDFGSCLVATSALGIAVDNTFHFLLCWKEQCACLNLSRATARSIELTARPFLITSFSLIAAFSVMLLARSEPVMHFGVLLSLTLFVGLFADLVVLPLLLGRGEVLFTSQGE